MGKPGPEKEEKKPLLGGGATSRLRECMTSRKEKEGGSK